MAGCKAQVPSLPQCMTGGKCTQLPGLALPVCGSHIIHLKAKQSPDAVCLAPRRRCSALDGAETSRLSRSVGVYCPMSHGDLSSPCRPTFSPPDAPERIRRLYLLREAGLYLSPLAESCPFGFSSCGSRRAEKSAFYFGSAGASWRLRSVLVSSQEVFVLGRSRPGGQMALMYAGLGGARRSIKVEKAASQASWPRPSTSLGLAPLLPAPETKSTWPRSQPFHTVHEVLKARMLKCFAIPFS